MKAVVETCHGRFYLQHGARPVLLLERSDCAANSRRASDDLCFSNSLALFNARRQTRPCDTARTAGICSARLHPISSTISMLLSTPITIPGHHRQVRRRHPQTVRLQGSSGVLACQLKSAWLRAAICFCRFMLRTRGAPTTASPGIRMYAAGFVAASAKKAFVSGLLVTWAGVRPALSWALMSAPCVRGRRGVSRSPGHRRSKRRLKMLESECFLEPEGKQRARAKGESIRGTHLAHQEAADLGVVISRSHMKRRAVFLQRSASIQHNGTVSQTSFLDHSLCQRLNPGASKTCTPSRQSAKKQTGEAKHQRVPC